MKKLDLNNYGVQEMNAEEMSDINGGILGLIVFAIGFGLLQLAGAIWPMD